MDEAWGFHSYDTTNNNFVKYNTKQILLENISVVIENCSSKLLMHVGI